MAKRTPDLNKVFSIAQAVNLESVYCREISAKRHLEVTAIPQQAQYAVGYEATGMRDLAANQILALIRCSFVATSSTAEPVERIAEIVATLALRYSVPNDTLKGFSPEAVQDFAEINGVYNAWPYWRELLQNTAARIGLQGVVAPVFRVIKEPKQVEEKTSR